MESPFEPAQPEPSDVSRPDVADPLAHHGPHAPPPVDVAALVARWIQRRYQESNQPIAIKASLLRQELLDSGIRVGRDKLYRVLEHLVSPPDPDNPKTSKPPFDRERIDQVWHYSPSGYQGRLQKIRPPRKAGTHQEPTGNSAGTHRELTGNSPGTHRELTGNSPGTQPQQEALVCPKHQIKLRRSKHRSGAFYCPATDPTGRNGYCVYTFAAAEMPAGVNLNVNPGTVNVKNEDPEDEDAGDAGQVAPDGQLAGSARNAGFGADVGAYLDWHEAGRPRPEDKRASTE